MLKFKNLKTIYININIYIYCYYYYVNVMYSICLLYIEFITASKKCLSMNF